MGWIHEYLGRVIGQPNTSPEMAELLSALANGSDQHRLALERLTTEGILYNDTYWKDHITSLAGVRVPGSANPPTVETNGEGWLFAGASTDNTGVLGTQINHDCQQGTVIIKPHVHWRKTTDATGDVSWKLEAKSGAVGGDFTAYAEVDTVNAPISATVDNDTAARHLITSFGDFELTVGLSTMVYFRITRVASDTVNDTYGADALLMSFDFHYPVSSPGSADEYSKGF